MEILSELQKRGFQVVICPGRVEITTNKFLRLQAIENRETVADQVNHAVLCIFEDTFEDELADKMDDDRHERELFRKETE